MKREPNLDLIRCVGLFFVNGVHCFLKNGFYSEPQTGAVIWAADCFRWLFFSCNGIFLLLTGYLKSRKPFSWGYYKSLLPIYIGYVLTCCITYPIRHFLLGEELPLSQWIRNLLGFSNYAWYLKMYFRLILISPLINLVLNHIKTGRGLWITAGIMLTLTAAHSITSYPILPENAKALYPVTYYVIGAAIRRTQPQVKPWQGLGAAALTVMGLGLTTVLLTDGGFAEGFTQGNGGFWNTLVAVSVFLGLYRVKLPEKAGRAVTWMAEGCLEGYLLSLVLDRSLYALVPQWHSPVWYPVLFALVTVPIFAVSVTAGKGVHTLARKLADLVPGYRKKAIA